MKNKHCSPGVKNIQTFSILKVILLSVMIDYFFKTAIFILSFAIQMENISHALINQKNVHNKKPKGWNDIQTKIKNYNIYCQSLIQNTFDLQSNNNKNIDCIDTSIYNGESTIVNLNDFKWRSNELSADMIKIIAKQLGYLPLNIMNVGVYKETNKFAMEVFHPVITDFNYNLVVQSSIALSSSTSSSNIAVNTNNAVTNDINNNINPKHPSIAIVYPLNWNTFNRQHKHDTNLKPFPTVIWLTCPELHTKISKLEDNGWISVLQKRLQEDSEEGVKRRQQMTQAHTNYATFRWSLLSETDRDYLLKSGWRPTLNEVGIAGIKNFDAVKCLHTHYAHFLCRPQDGNLIGEWTHELLVIQERTAAIAALPTIEASQAVAGVEVETIHDARVQH